MKFKVLTDKNQNVLLRSDLHYDDKPIESTLNFEMFCGEPNNFIKLHPNSDT